MKIILFILLTVSSVYAQLKVVHSVSADQFAVFCKTFATYSFDSENKQWEVVKVYAGDAPKIIEMSDAEFYTEDRKRYLETTPKVLFEYKTRYAFMRHFKFYNKGKLHFQKKMLSGTSIPRELGINHDLEPIIIVMSDIGKKEQRVGDGF